MSEVKERPIIFGSDMVKAIINGKKTQTRRVIKHLEYLDISSEKNSEGIELSSLAVKFSKPVKGKRGVYTGGPFSKEKLLIWFANDLCPLGKVGDRLWVRETFQLDPSADDDLWGDDGSRLSFYEWDGCGCKQSDLPEGLRTLENVIYKADYKDPSFTKWRSPIFMPRWASRLLLEITDVRMERLQDISDADLEREGMPPSHESFNQVSRQHGYRHFPQSCFAQKWDELNGKHGYDWASNPWVWVISFKVVEK